MARREKRRRLRRKIMLVCGLLIAFIAIWFAVGRVTSSQRAVRVLSDSKAIPIAAPDRPNTLRIGVYNIAHGRGQAASNWDGGTPAERRARLDRIADWIVRANLDVIVLNEVDFDSTWSGGVNQARFIAQRAGFEHRIEQRNIDVGLPLFSLRFGNAILSRHPIRNARLLDWPTYSALEALLLGKKRGVICEILLDDETRFRLIAVHLEPRDSGLRLKSAEMIAQLAQTGGPPLIAAGDFNSKLMQPDPAGADSENPSAVSYLLGTGLFRSGLAAAPGQADFTFPAWRPVRTIDWILVPPECSMVARSVPHVVESDHLPVVMELYLAEED